MNVYAVSRTVGRYFPLLLAANCFATTPTLTVNADDAPPREDAWGPAATLAAKRSASGSKTDTALEKIPQSVSVVTAAELQRMQPQSVKEALSYTPGVTVNASGSANLFDNVAIRGFGGQQNINEYLDGIKLQGDSYSLAAIDPYMLERVEVLHGPASVLYGKSSPGGLIALVSKQPLGERLREIQFQMGNQNLYETGFDFSDIVDDDPRYSWRLTGLARSNDAQQVNAREKRYAVAPSFRWQPNVHTSLTLLTQFQHEPESGYNGWLPRQGTVEPFVTADGKQHKLSTRFSDGERSGRYQHTQNLAGYRLIHDLSDSWQVRQNVRYMHLDSHSTGFNGIGYIAPQTLMRSSAHFDERLSNIDVDTQMEGKLASGPLDHRLLFGIDYMHMRDDINGFYGLADPLDLLNPQYGDDTIPEFGRMPQKTLDRQQQTGIYAQDQAQWRRWVVTLGGRYDWAMTSAFDRVARSTNRRHDKQFSWRGGVNYLFDNGIAPYFSFSESFQPTSGSDVHHQTFSPSRGKQYELGLKFVPQDRPIVLTAALFQLVKNKNLVVDTSVGAGMGMGSFSKQAGKTRSRGLELEAKAAVNLNLNLSASYTFTDVRYARDGSEQSDRRPYQIPANMASLWADYTFHQTALSGLTLGSGVRYVGSSWGDTANSFKVKPYTLVDAVMRYDLARVGLPGSNVALNINNLLDRHYVASCMSGYACYWGRDRRIIATMTFRY